MPVSDAFSGHMRDLFAPYGEVSIRKMFGGAGLYVDGRICAVLIDDVLYLKTDVQTRAGFEAAGCEPFTYDMNGKTGVMAYYAAPDDVYDDPDVAEHWIRLALGAAARAPAPKKKRRK